MRKYRAGDVDSYVEFFMTAEDLHKFIVMLNDCIQHRKNFNIMDSPCQCTCQGRDHDPPILNDILCPVHSVLVNSPPKEQRKP